MDKELEKKLSLLGISSNISITDLILIREAKATELIDDIINLCEQDTGRKYYHPRIRFPEDKPSKIRRSYNFKGSTNDVVSALEEHGSFKSTNSFADYLADKHGYSETTGKRKIKRAWSNNEIHKVSTIIDGKETFVYTIKE